MTNEQIENEAASYVGDILGLDYIGEAEAERAFKAGASWRINSVWHDVKEEPKRDVWILAQIGDDVFDTTIIEAEDNWDKLSMVMNIMRWTYVSDLLPDGKEDGK